MENTSPILKTRIENREINTASKFQTPKVNTSDTKLKTLDGDKVELSNKKKAKTKKIIKYIAAGTLVAGVCVAAVKCINTSKAKKEITALYDAIFENMQKNGIGADFNFEKPKLVFKNPGKSTKGSYSPFDNTINVDWRMLKSTVIPKDGSFVNSGRLGVDQYRGTLLDIIKDIIKNGRTDIRVASKNESLTLMGATLSHELEHAKQFQMLLSSEGGKEKFLSSLKKKSTNLTDKTLKEIFPFVFNYKPAKMLSPSKTQIYEKLPNGNIAKYGINNILNAFTNYTNKDKLKYYSNLTEISARNAERKYYEKLLSGELKAPKGVSREFIEQRRDYFADIVNRLFNRITAH